jgi:Transposase DDE domain
MLGKRLLNKQKQLLKCSEFINNHRVNAQDFIRKRILTIDKIAFTILKLITKSLQIECEFLESDPEKNAPSKQAFSKARYKMKHTGFIELFNQTVTVFYKDSAALGKWLGYRIIACDGSTIKLPDSKEIEEKFGRYNTNQHEGNHPILARISLFADVCCSMILDAQIGSSKIGEREMAKKQLPIVTKKMRDLGQDSLLYIYDRGYVSKEAIAQHIDLNVDFIFRIQKGNYTHIWDRVKRGEIDFEEVIDGHKVRAVAIVLSTEEIELLVTSLRDKQKITLKHLNQLYQLRWRIEECYKKIKVTSELGNFSGNKLEAILQDFWGHLTICNTLTVFIRDKEAPWNPEDIPEYRINFSVVLGTMREKLRDCWLGNLSEDKFFVLFERVSKRAKVKVRPGRSFERKNIGKPKRHHAFRRVC